METISDRTECCNSTRNELKSLFTLCIEYISRNIFMVESLQDFPDIIGEEIYKYCQNTDCFSENNRATEHAIKLFVNAYGNDFIHSLSIQSRKIISEFGECLCILCLPVTKLDLRNCRLGNNNDILKVFVEMNNLQVLNIANNDLSEDGFRVILARHKMYKIGFKALEQLDISENNVSLRVLKSVLSLPSLKCLKISIAASAYALNPKIKKDWDDIIKQKGFKLSLANTDLTVNIINDGWGSNIIKIWENKATEWELERLEKWEKKSKSFYSNAMRKASVDLKFSGTKYDTYATFTYLKTIKENLYFENGNRTEIESKKEKTQSGCKQGILSEPSDVDLELLRLYVKK